jgi:hypothetical protein
MIKAEAKKLSIEVWTYLAEHPEIRYKCDLPKELWEKIKRLPCECPLCAAYISCDECLLNDKNRNSGCAGKSGLYYQWAHSKTALARAKAARRIVVKVEAWEVDE